MTKFYTLNRMTSPRHETPQSILDSGMKPFGVEALYLFGSHARGDTHTGSDTDIAYVTDTPLHDDALLALHTLLRDAGYHGTLDLVDATRASPLLQYRIAREGQQIAGSARTDEAFVRTAWKRYIDARRIRDATEEYVHRLLH